MAYDSLQNCVPLSDLSPNITHPNVVGVIIGKTDARGFPDRRNVGSERFTFGFTIKDTPDHFINVSAWGKEEYVLGLCSRFKVGDCVVIENPLVVIKDPEKEDRFCPSTPSFYRLLVTESHSAIRMCSDLETETRLLPLFHIPVKDSRDFYSLGDITANGQSLDGNFINILAAVRSIGESRHFTTSDGRNGQRLEIKLFDNTLATFPLICWDQETIQLLQTLTPQETVLFIVDARISFDSFRNSMVSTATSKTIITINPDTAEANQLFSYARELSEFGQLDEQDIEMREDLPLESITDVLTVKQIKAKAQENSNIFHCVIYAFITTLGLDSSISRIICSRCARCKFYIYEDIGTCTNTSCPNQGQPHETTVEFNLWVDISDHTGTLKACSLSGTVAEKSLGCTSEEFMCLSEQQRITMKWRFLLERCKIYLKVFPSTKYVRGIRANILSCTHADPVEVKQSMSAIIN
ncbi:meiosis-specific with OB domain-containing protein [Hoplias malabaricus]|uniref:meiosis-specific with OB domain-containing protein n=1 Tax=Hoplias malabaricus TaxID=27720 RepID=UPI0034634821